MKKWLLCAIAVSALLVSCKNKSEQEIEATAESGVVLVQNQSYFELVLPSGSSLYFSSFDEDGDVSGLAFDEDSVEVSVSYGTGFFVSSEGQIATNAHVVDNMVGDKAANRSVKKVFDGMKAVLQETYSEYKTKYDNACTLAMVALYDSGVSAEDYQTVCAVRDAIKEEMNECEQVYGVIDDFKASDCDIKYHNRVSVAYNNTFVTSTSDFTECVVTDTDHEHDLAILQLKDKQTPEGRYVFAIPEADPLTEYSFMDNVKKKMGADKNAQLYMLSFNLGPALALTKEGIKSQFNNGTISQKTSDRLMYSIPALHGSSGSPVLNHEGELVAVNYAGINGTQGFNYGIRVKHLRALLGD